MESIGLIATVASAAASVAGAGLGVVQGIQSSRGARLEVQQHEEEARLALLAADQEEVQKRRRLETVLANNEALRGARGLTFDSGSARALREANIAEAEDDIAIGRLNRLNQARRSEYAAMGARMRGQGGLFSGAGAVLTGISSAGNSLMRFNTASSSNDDWFSRGLKGR